MASNDCWRVTWHGEKRSLSFLADEVEDQAMAVVLMDAGDAESWVLEAYLADAPEQQWLTGLTATPGRNLSTPVLDHLAARDWVADSDDRVRAVRAGRFLAHGAATTVALEPGDIEVVVEASLAFGTGEHGSTRGCLLALERLVSGKVPDAVLDMGCGSAILAIAAAKLWPSRVLAADNDPDALVVARRHVFDNGVAHNVSLANAAAYDAMEINAAAPFGLILANILSGPLQALAPGLPKVLARGGRVVLSGFTPDQAESVLVAYQALGMEVEFRLDVSGWTTLVLKEDEA
jgi:ribosomal protein L11 methyltransferase